MTGHYEHTFDRRSDTGPFDIIGDVHGCADELEALLEQLGYEVTWPAPGLPPVTSTPAGRRAIFVGDLCGRPAKWLKLVLLYEAGGQSRP